MWEETLIESKGIRQNEKKWFTFPISLLAHAAVIAIVIGTSYWYVEAVVARPPMPIVFHTAIAPPASGNDGLAEHSKKPERVVRKTQEQPAMVPELVIENVNSKPETESPGSAADGSTPGNPEGVDGGSGIGSGPWGIGITGKQAEEDIIYPSPEVREPVLIHKVKPEYPANAIHARIQGFVFLEAIISKTGTVEDLRVVQSANPLLTQAALKAVRQWRYRPAMLNGRPVRVYFNVTVEFKLY